MAVSVPSQHARGSE
jgi:outer membrane immunogenic protein